MTKAQKVGESDDHKDEHTKEEAPPYRTGKIFFGLRSTAEGVNAGSVDESGDNPIMKPINTTLKVPTVNSSGRWAITATIHMTILALMPATRPATRLARMPIPSILSGVACCDIFSSLSL